MEIIAGTSNLPLAESVVKILGSRLLATSVQRFSDNETSVVLQESVRGRDIYVLQSTSSPVNDNIIELMIMLDALKRSSANRVTVVLPYYGYARQDRIYGCRTGIPAKLMAKAISEAGADRIIALDLHSPQIQGFFDIPVDNLSARGVFADDIAKKFAARNITIVSPDIGGVTRARAVAERLGVPLAIVDKKRDSNGLPRIMNIIGDINKRDCIIIDDIVDSAGTLCSVTDVLIRSGANNVSAYVTHPVLSGAAVSKVENSALSNLVVTDSIHCEALHLSKCKKVRVTSIAPLIAEAIKAVATEEPISALFY